MAVIHDEFDPVIGPLVAIQLSMTRSDRRRRWRNRQTVPPAIQAIALIDTGAECSCLSSSIIRLLDLPLLSVNLVNLPMVHGLTPTFFREVDMTISMTNQLPLMKKTWTELQIVEIDLYHLGYEAILGRDVLADCHFEYSGKSNTYTLTF